jgi:hypothetical protein
MMREAGNHGTYGKVGWSRDELHQR